MTKARKNHQCGLCGYPIPKGMEYERYDATPWDPNNDEREYITFRSHKEDWKIITALGIYADEGIGDNDFLEDLSAFFEGNIWDCTEHKEAPTIHHLLQHQPKEKISEDLKEALKEYKEFLDALPSYKTLQEE